MEHLTQPWAYNERGETDMYQHLCSFVAQKGLDTSTRRQQRAFRKWLHKRQPLLKLIKRKADVDTPRGDKAGLTEAQEDIAHARRQ